MTPTERTEKILSALCEMGCCDRDISDPVCDDRQSIYLTAQIEEACAEAVRVALDEFSERSPEFKFYQDRAYAEGFSAAKEKAIKAIPTSWLDSLLSGPNAVDGKPTDGCPYIEAVLKGIADRIAGMEAGDVHFKKP